MLVRYERDANLGAIMKGYRESMEKWWLPLLLMATSVMAQGMGWVDVLHYDRGLVAAEPWRLLTAHVVHLGWMHLALNLVGLGLIWVLFGRRLVPWAWTVALVVCALAVSLGLWWRDADLAWYVGLSGVLHGLLVLGALAALKTERRTALLVLAGIALKLAWEQYSGGDAGTAALVGGAVIVNAHLYGALGGLLCAPLARRAA